MPDHHQVRLEDGAVRQHDAFDADRRPRLPALPYRTTTWCRCVRATTRWRHPSAFRSHAPTAWASASTTVTCDTALLRAGCDFRADESGADDHGARAGVQRRTDGERVVERTEAVHTVEVFGPGQRAKLRAGRDDQCVVADLAVAHEHDLAGDVQTRCRSAEKEFDVEFAAKTSSLRKNGIRASTPGAVSSRNSLDSGGRSYGRCRSAPIRVMDPRIQPCAQPRRHEARPASRQRRPAASTVDLPAWARSHSALDSQCLCRASGDGLFDRLQLVVGDVLLEKDELHRRR